MGVCRRVAGSGGALKLTSALYALALVPALMCDGARLRARLLALGIVIVVAGCVFVLVAGPWYWQVWQHLGNPLFPQFNGLFKSPLAAPVSIADTRWLPRNLGEHLLWPLLFTLKPQRIGDLGLVQALWAVLYALVLIVAARAVLRCRVAGVGLDRSATVVLVFVATAYVLWQAIFSIHRYLVVLELLAPVVLWICCRHAFAQRADHKAAWLIGLCALVAVAGWKDWGTSPGRARRLRSRNRRSSIRHGQRSCWSAMSRSHGASPCCRSRAVTSGSQPTSARPMRIGRACAPWWPSARRFTRCSVRRATNSRRGWIA